MDFSWAWYFFDYAGTIAFAISGALVGVVRRMDIFGMIVLALATAIGGGIIRDVLVGNTPPKSLQSSIYVVMTLVTTGIVFIIYRYRFGKHITGRWARVIYLLADTLGLASFTVTGAAVGYKAYPDLGLLSVVLGLLTAVGGGIIRDVLAQRIPSVLREEVYALPSIIGGIVYYTLAINGFYLIAAYIAFIIVFVIRCLAIYYKWSLPKVGRRR